VADLALAPHSDDEMRLLAVTALGRLGQPRALETLLRLADGGRTFLGRLRLPPKTPVLIAALRSLARGWSTDPRARAILNVAGESSDAEVVDAARGAHR
jgi:HEAT repeat protein